MGCRYRTYNPQPWGHVEAGFLSGRSALGVGGLLAAGGLPLRAKPPSALPPWLLGAYNRAPSSPGRGPLKAAGRQGARRRALSLPAALTPNALFRAQTTASLLCPHGRCVRLRVRTRRFGFNGSMCAHLLRNGAEIFAAYVVTACRGCRAASRPLRPKGHVSLGAANF